MADAADLENPADYSDLRDEVLELRGERARLAARLAEVERERDAFKKDAALAKWRIDQAKEVCTNGVDFSPTKSDLAWCVMHWLGRFPPTESDAIDAAMRADSAEGTGDV